MWMQAEIYNAIRIAERGFAWSWLGAPVLR